MRDLRDTQRTALLVVDLQNENLDGGAWPVHNYKLVLANATRVIAAARRAGMPVIYTRHWLHPRGWDAMRHEPLGSDGRPEHSVAGSAGAEICEEVAPEPGELVVDKCRFSAFYGTKLDHVLRRLDAEHLIVIGVWTEACLETTVWDALWRDYRVTLVKDACGAATDTVHKAAVLDMANWLYGGGVVRTAELEKALAGQAYEAWAFEKANAFPYTLETLEELYERL